MRKLILSIIGLFFIINSFAQTVTIGNGTIIRSAPWSPLQNFSYCQVIYLASEINSSGNITSVKFYFSGNNLINSNRVSVYMAHSVKSYFVSKLDYLPFDSLTNVFADTVSATTLPGWVSINLSTPFNYNGVDNLVIVVAENQPGKMSGTSSAGFSAFNANQNRSIKYFGSTAQIDPYNPQSTISSVGVDVPNIQIEGLTASSCYNVPKVTIANITTNSATISWPSLPSGKTATGYQWEVRKSGNPGSGPVGLGASGTALATDTSASVNGLDSSTYYSAYVRAICSPGVYGAWSPFITTSSFLTLCAAYNVPYLLDFNDGYLPLCTTNPSYGLGNWWNIGGNTSTGTWYLRYCSPNNGAQADAYFNTGEIILNVDSTYTVSFDYGASPGFHESLSVAGIVWANYSDLNYNGTYESEFKWLVNQNAKLTFHCTSIADQECITIDNILVKKTTCGKPLLVTKSNVTSSSVDIKWHPSTIGIASNYQIYYSFIPTHSEGYKTPVLTVSDTLATLSNLQRGTKYYFSVRAYCGGNETSIWSPLDSFVTVCDTSYNVPYLENFESVTVPSIPQCSNVESTDGNNWVTNNNPGFGFRNKCIKHNYSNPNPSNSWYFTQGLNLVAGKVYRLVFKYGSNNSATTEGLEVKLGSNSYSGSMIYSIVNYPSIRLDSSATSYSIFAPPATGVYFIGFHDYSNAYQGTLFIDDIIVSEINTLTVSAYLDQNANSIQDNNEPYFNNGNIATIKNVASEIISNSSNGINKVYIDTGSYITTVNSYSPYYTINPLSHTTSFQSYSNIDSVSFALKPMIGKNDLSINLFNAGIVRPGFPATYHIFYRNTGTDTITNGTVSLIKDGNLNYSFSSPIPVSINGDTLKWNFSNLYPQDTANIIINFTVSPPPIVSIGDTIKATAIIASNNTDLTPIDNTSTLKQLVRGSYDPNDKTENHGGKLTSQQVANGEYLHYTIRFQNTGTDTAFNINIQDTLDSKLDWNTIQMLTASHSYQMTMNDGNKCTFSFKNINLVDSITNEPASHGYIVYKIKPKQTVALGDTIKNRAAIYFDFNPAVITNTETTLILNEVLPLRLLSFSARKENKTNLLSWTTINEMKVDHFEIERSNNGREFSKIGITKANSTNQINTYQYSDAVAPNSPLWGAGGLYYRLKMIDKDGQFSYSPIRSLTINNSSLIITLFPNPAKDNLQIQIESDKKTAIQLVMLSADGKVLLSKSIIANEGSSLQSINISTLPKGSYLLKVKSDKDEQVMKFEKL